MLRAAAAVILGYLTTAILVFATFTGAYLVMGADGAFKPGSYEVTATWLVASFALGLVAAVAGGWTCAAVARSGRAPMVLAVLVLVLGLLAALPAITKPQPAEPKVREGNVGHLEAMQNADQPVWVVLLNPLIGAAGVTLGARLSGRVRESAPGRDAGAMAR